MATSRIIIHSHEWMGNLESTSDFEWSDAHPPQLMFSIYSMMQLFTLILHICNYGEKVPGLCFIPHVKFTLLPVSISPVLYEYNHPMWYEYSTAVFSRRVSKLQGFSLSVIFPFSCNYLWLTTNDTRVN